MRLDISDILDGWPYEPGQVTVRRIRGSDGQDKIQLRLDLGLLQMETTGRPDGERPHGCESLLDYYRRRLRQHIDEHGGDEGFELDERDCELLRAEATMFYHRYLAEFVLEDFEAVDRDAVRNLELFDFCQEYARDESDRTLLEQYRPYVMMMVTRSRAQRHLRDNRPKAALVAIRRGIHDIEDFYTSYGFEDPEDASGELAVLKALAAEIRRRLPADPVKKLQKQLNSAVREERYEDAAELRDQIRSLKRH